MEIEYKVGTDEHIVGYVTANRVLDAQPVFVTIDNGATWLPAEWTGEPGTTRWFRSTAPVEFAAPRRGRMSAKVVDISEQPIIELGDFKVTPL